MGYDNEWPVVSGSVDPAYQAAVTAALAGKADAAAVTAQNAIEADTVDVAGAAPALALLGAEEGIAWRFDARSAARRSDDGTKTLLGEPGALCTFTRAQAAFTRGKRRLLETIGANLIRYEYDPTWSTPLGALLQRSSTNLYLNSIVAGSQTLEKVTLSTDTTVAPDGTTTADTLTLDGTLGGHYIYNTITATASTAHTFGRWIKAGASSPVPYVFLEVYPGFLAGTSSNAVGLMLDVVNKSVSPISGAGWSAPLDYGLLIGDNGWCKPWLAATSGSAPTAAAFATHLALSNSTADYTGDGASTCLLWNAQVETGRGPTSDIITAGSTVTRAADLMSFLLADVANFSQTDYTIAVEFTLNYLAGNQRVFVIGDGTNSNIVEVVTSSSTVTNLMIQAYSGGTYRGAANVTPSLVAGTKFRVAMCPTATGYRWSINGSAPATFTPSLMPAGTMTTCHIGNRFGGAGAIGGQLRNSLIINRISSDAEMQALSTPLA